MMWGDGWGWGMGWPMLIGGLVPLLVLVLFVYLLSQAISSGRAAALPPSGAAPARPAAPARQGTALEIAQRRYASGELSREEFVRIKDDLGGTAAPG